MIKFCGECGDELKDNAKFCGKCGTTIENNGVANVVAAASPSEGVKSSKRRMTNKLLFKLTVWPWVTTLILALLMVFVGDSLGTFFGGVALIGGFMILIFGIWGLIRLSKAKRKIATVIVVCTVLVLVFQKVELIYDLSMIGLFISTIMGLAELNKLPDVGQS